MKKNHLMMSLKKLTMKGLYNKSKTWFRGIFLRHEFEDRFIKGINWTLRFNRYVVWKVKGILNNLVIFKICTLAWGCWLTQISDRERIIQW